MKAEPRLDQYEDFFGIPDDEVDVTGAEAFLEQHPGFPATEFNGEIMVAWCRSRGIPCTNLNLSVAFKELQQAGMLEAVAPRGAVSSSFGPPVGVFINGFADENGEALKKLADDPTLSDQTRKKRFAALKQLATQQRLRNRQGTPLRGSEKVVI